MAPIACGESLLVFAGCAVVAASYREQHPVVNGEEMVRREPDVLQDQLGGEKPQLWG